MPNDPVYGPGLAISIVQTYMPFVKRISENDFKELELLSRLEQKASLSIRCGFCYRTLAQQVFALIRHDDLHSFDRLPSANITPENRGEIGTHRGAAMQVTGGPKPA